MANIESIYETIGPVIQRQQTQEGTKALEMNVSSVRTIIAGHGRAGAVN